MKFSVFSVPKPFRDSEDGNFALTQRNAILSWLRLGCEVILMGDDEGVADFAAAHGARHLPEVERTAFGMLSLKSILGQAQGAAAHDLTAMVNADIVLMSDFVPALEKSAALGDFLMVGFRWTKTVPFAIDFDSPTWEQDLKSFVLDGGERNGRGSDYFAFRRGLYDDVPEFGLGFFHWDGWMMGHALRRGAALVDATEAVFAVHQNHRLRWGGCEEAKHNQKLLGGVVAWPQDATHRLGAEGRLWQILS